MAESARTTQYKHANKMSTYTQLGQKEKRYEVHLEETKRNTSDIKTTDDRNCVSM